jgi:hypothetical protein
MQKAIGRFRYSLKRTQNIAIAADTPANEASRLDFARWYLRITLAGRKILFIDEVVSQGRSPIGVRVQNGVPAIRTRNMNVMSAIHTGMTLSACSVTCESRTSRTYGKRRSRSSSKNKSISIRSCTCHCLLSSYSIY